MQMHDRLTRGDIEKMQNEIDYRETELRPQILDELNEARAQGDLSENAEYTAAKKARGRNESRIRYLKNMIKTAVIIEDHSGPDEVGLNKWVTVYFEEDDEEEKYKIVTSIRGDSLNGRITQDSPMARALMHHRVGDRVRVHVNEDISYFVVIRAIEGDGTDEDDKIQAY